MPISYLYTGEPMNGTANDDFVIAFKGSTGTDNNTINGNAGDDLIIADSSDTWIPNSSYLNGSIGTAFNLETLTSTWTTAENEMFGDSTIPHTTVMAEATIGQSEMYRVAVGAGQQITIDIDFASNSAIGVGGDLVVELQDSLGNIIATADDSLVTDGGRGSVASTPGIASSYDPYLTFTVANGGIYYINVRPFGGGPGTTFSVNQTFVMNVSVTGHAVNATNPVQGADTISGGDGDDSIFGQGGNDIINGGIGNDTIDAGSGADIVHGDEGNDILYGGDGSEENIHGDAGDDTLISGGEGHYYGDEGNDTILAGLTSGINEVLDGGAGIDTLDTRTWNGAYTIDLDAGTSDFGETFTNFENIITGNGTDTITGTAGANVITTNGGTDVVNADAGDDIVAGGADGDTLDGGADFDILNYRLSSGAVTINLATNSANGGHATGDLISNFEGVWGSVLSDTLTGNDGDNELRGFEGNDILVGGAGNDILDGGINDDTMTGGTGDDTYYLDSPGDIINELAGEGNDTIAVAMTYALAGGSTLENLATIDPNASTAINLTGNSGANALTGNAGANTLNGGGGADTMAGLLGDDKYYVDSAGDVVTESAGEGDDWVLTTLSYTLAAGMEIEQLSTTNGAGLTLINLTGNEFDNAITGNAASNILTGGLGNDTLDGKLGADTMKGGAGDDTFIVDNAGDVVTENGGAGTDLVKSSITYALTNAVENLTLTGAGAINATGNSIGNVITGNGAANVIDGGGGADTMKGGLGNDTYLVGQLGDVVMEGASAGTDEVQASVTCTLSSNVENLTLTGASAINGTGNNLANIITGNDEANTLTGGAGTDTLTGGGGNDTLDGGLDRDVLTGGTGADFFVFRPDGTAANQTDADKINDFSTADGDKIDLHYIDANGAVAGNGAFNFIGTAAFSNTAGELRYEVSGGFTFVSGDMDGDGVADMVIRLVGTPLLAATDFVL